MIIVDDILQGSDEWLKERLGKVTGSMVSNVMSKGRGSSPSKLSETYMIELISETLTGKSKPFFENEAMRWGTATEPQARDMYSIKNDFVDIREIAYFKSGDSLLGSPDGLVGERGLIEIKCPNTTTQIKRALTDDYSADYKSQIQFLLWISEREWCDFVSFDPRLDCAASYLSQRVYRDEEYIKDMKTKVYAFVERMNLLIEQLTK